MKKEDLFDAVTEIDDRHIAHAEQHRFRQPFAWKRVGALAACGVLAVGLTQFIPSGGSSDAAASEPASAESSAGASGNCAEGGFDVYQPPVLPLFVTGEGTEELERERTLTFDYSETDTYSGTHAAAAQVTDSYVLMNPTHGDILAVVSYPTGGALDDTLPVLTVDGQPVESALSFSDPLVTFSEDGWGLVSPRTVAPYAAAIEDTIAGNAGIIETQAVEELPALTEPVTVYTFTDASGSEEHAAILQYAFTCDPAATTILSYGFNGWSEISDRVQAYDFFVNEHTAPETRMLIVLGGDIADGRLQGYQNGACRDGEELDGLTAHITRTETTLGEALATVVQSNIGKLTAHGKDVPITFEEYYAAAAAWYALHGPTGSEPAARYEEGRLDELADDVLVCGRMRWQTVEITIPAGESRTIEARSTCRGSYNRPSGANDPDVYGYSLMTIADAAWPTTLRLLNTGACEGMSCMLTTTDGVIDALDLTENAEFTLSPATGYHSFTLRE